MRIFLTIFLLIPKLQHCSLISGLSFKSLGERAIVNSFINKKKYLTFWKYKGGTNAVRAYT